MLKDPSVRMHEIEVSLFSPFRPMLGDRGKPNQVRDFDTTSILSEVPLK